MGRASRRKQVTRRPVPNDLYSQVGELVLEWSRCLQTLIFLETSDSEIERHFFDKNSNIWADKAMLLSDEHASDLLPRLIAACDNAISEKDLEAVLKVVNAVKHPIFTSLFSYGKYDWDGGSIYLYYSPRNSNKMKVVPQRDIVRAVNSVRNLNKRLSAIYIRKIRHFDTSISNRVMQVLAHGARSAPGAHETRR